MNPAQPAKTNSLFRQEALDHLATPEALDRTIQVVQPHAWLTLSAIGLLLAVAGFWSVFGRIPLTVTGQGILIKPRQVVPFQATASGQLVTLTVKPGDRIKKGDVIGVIDQSLLQQQLQLANAKLAELQNQNQNTGQLQQQLLTQQLVSLDLQQQDSLKSLQRERMSLELRQNSQQAITEKRISMNTRKQQLNLLLKTLEDQVNSRRQLFAEKIISREIVTRAEQDYFNAQAQLSDIDVQLKDLDIQTTNAKQTYLQNLNTIDALQTKAQELATQQTKLREQTLLQTIDRSKEIQELKRQIEQLQLQLTKSKLISPYEGRVLEVNLSPGQVVNPGIRLGAIEVENTKAQLTCLVYLSNQDGKQVQSGMKAQITPSIAKRERHGGILGTVTEVSPFPVTQQEIATAIGNEEVTANLSNKGNALIQIATQLQLNPTTASGYHWSSQEGALLKVSSGTTTTVEIKVGERTPISYLLPMMRSWLGMST